MKLPIRLCFRDNVRSDSGPFNDELGTEDSRLPSNFSSCTDIIVKYYFRVISRTLSIGYTLKPGRVKMSKSI